MSIGLLTAIRVYSCDGSVTSFAAGFKDLESLGQKDLSKDDIIVLHHDGTTKKETPISTYTISGSNIITDTVYPNEDKVIIYPDYKFTQTYQFSIQKYLDTAAVEIALDRSALQGQYLTNAITRTLKTALSDDTIDMTIPPKSERIGKYLAFDSEGKPIVVDLEGGEFSIDEIALTGGVIQSLVDLKIVASTENGADNRSVGMGGGGDTLSTRGGNVITYGNEHPTKPGVVEVIAGDNGEIDLKGKISDRIMTFWKSGDSHSINRLVWHNEKRWKSLENNNTEEPSKTSAKWRKMASSPGTKWDEYSEYNTGEIAWLGDSFFSSKIENNIGNEPVDGDNWKFEGKLDFADFQGQIDALITGTAGAGLDSFHYYGSYKDRSSAGLYPFSFGTTLLKKKSNFPAMYSEVGDKYNQMHIDAGDPTPAADEFYIGPIPGAYGRIGIPDVVVSTFSDLGGFLILTHTVEALKSSNTGRDGTPFILKGSGTPPAGLTLGAQYYLRFRTDFTANIYASEANAIENINPIAYTDSGSGTFRLTQEGVAIDYATEKHRHGLNHYNSGGPGVNPPPVTYTGGTGYSGIIETDSQSGNTSNETRPTTYYEFGYVKAEDVTPAGEPVSALRFQWERGDSSIWNGELLSIQHNLNTDCKDLLVKVEIKRDGVFEWQEVKSVYIDLGIGGVSTETYGCSVINNGLLNSFDIQIGDSGLLGYNTAGARVTIQSGNIGNIRVTAIKPNLVTTYADTNFRKVYNIVDSTDIIHTLPDASTMLTEQIIKRRGSGTGKVIFATVSGQTIEGLTASTWELEGEGEIVVFPYAGNWEVKDYKDYLTDTPVLEEVRFTKKYKDGSMYQSRVNRLLTANNNDHYFQMIKPFTNNYKGEVSCNGYGLPETTWIGYSIKSSFLSGDNQTVVVYHASTDAQIVTQSGAEATGRWRE